MSQNCSNCYNNCSEIVSDKCIKYTGVPVPLLGIQTGDSLSYVEQAIITFLGSVLNGSGIKITLDESIYCELVSQYLQECQEVTALDLFKALVQATCDLQEQIDTIEANYTVDCLDGVSTDSGTHAIVQATIDKLCEVEDNLETLSEAVDSLSTDLDTNYVKIVDINSYIAAYIASTTSANRYYTRMVPYCPIPYIGSLSFFDATGAGITNTEWEKIYLCNGLNGTPDMRGRVPVGAIVGVPGGAMSSIVDPSSDPTFNPNYAVGDVAGANKIILTITEMPTHAHGITDDGHSHLLVNEDAFNAPLNDNRPIAIENTGAGDDSYALGAVIGGGDATVGKSSTSITGVELTNTGGNEAHDNKQPALATYFIMYIP